MLIVEPRRAKARIEVPLENSAKFITEMLEPICTFE
jgi:hypothetical protein